MKTFSTVTVLVTLLSGPAVQLSLRAQANTLATPRPPAAPAPAAAPAPPAGGLPQVAEQVEVLIKDAARSANDAMRSALKSAHSSLWENEPPAFQFGSGARSSSRSLAIQISSAEPEKVDDIEEDLSVMARILQKAARSLRDDERYNAMGIDLDSSVFGSASGARNLYVEGQGAIFLLSVKYPLVGLAEATPADEPAPAPDTEWERTKEEVLGGARPHAEHETVTSFRSSRGKPEPFDELKVAGLKLALLSALTNASNIRYLAPNEFVTLVVQGGDASTEGSYKVVTSSSSGGAGTAGNRAEVRVRKEVRNSVDSSRKSAPKGESVLSIRVKKSDLDAIATGGISFDDFRRKATVLTYLRRGDSGAAHLNRK